MKRLKGFEKAQSLKERCPGTTVVSVCDSEADVFELFSLQRTGRDEAF